MNLILLFPSDFISQSSRVVLSGRRHAHVLDIIKPKLGDVLTVGLEGGLIGEGRVERINDKILEMSVQLSQKPPRKLDVILCVALMRPIVLKRVLQTAAAMGVGEIHLFHSRQVEKSFWQSTALRPEAIREEFILGLEQAQDTVLPAISFHKRFKPFVEDVLPGLLDGRAGLVADPSGEILPPSELRRQTPGVCSSSTESCVVLIGPEGGFIPYEVEKFREAGCRVMGLGARILKVETAIVACLSKIS